MIEVRNVYKSFGSQVVLNGINLDIHTGRTTTIVGPSGVGKSVLLKLIMGIMQPDRGEIIVFGENITKARSEAAKNKIRASLGVLFQSAALFDSLTVYDNIAFPLLERGRLSSKERHKKVVEMIEALSLENQAQNYPEEISMGMRKRVGMARSLITEPKILLFDEPNTGLDPLTGQEVYDLIKMSQKKWGFTGIVISHEIPEVFQVSDRVVMLLRGNIIQEGTPEDFINTKDESVRQFLEGNINGPIKIQ
jgi:phospholipid/cholesterol/gamma-HCH transport system ATP-binding protein